MLQKGERVIVEGPWGRFRPDFSAQKQLWLAGGVGIAPFCAWMQDAAQTAHGKIRLVWCIKSKESEPMFANVEKMAERAGIRLEVFESAKKRLNAESLFAGAVPDTVALCAGEGQASAVSRPTLRPEAMPTGFAKNTLTGDKSEYLLFREKIG